MTLLYSDNTRVARGKWGAEYLSIAFWDSCATKCDKCLTNCCPQSVSLTRYCVPGRCDTYDFDWTQGNSGHGNHVRYSSEGEIHIGKSLTLVQKDLDRPQVIELIVTACRLHYLHSVREFTERLLASIAPKSKSLRAARKEIAKRKKANAP